MAWFGSAEPRGLMTGLTIAIVTACATESGISSLSRTAAGGTSEASKVAQPIREAVAAIRGRLRSGATPTNLRTISTDLVHVNDAGEIQVYVILTESRPEYVAQLQAVGLRVEQTLPDFRLVQGWIAANLVDRIASLAFVTEVKPPGYPVPRGD